MDAYNNYRLNQTGRMLDAIDSFTAALDQSGLSWSDATIQSIVDVLIPHICDCQLISSNYLDICQSLERDIRRASKAVEIYNRLSIQYDDHLNRVKTDDGHWSYDTQQRRAVIEFNRDQAVQLIQDLKRRVKLILSDIKDDLVNIK